MIERIYTKYNILVYNKLDGYSKTQIINFFQIFPECKNAKLFTNNVSGEFITI